MVEGKDKSEGTLVGVGHRQHREEDIILANKEQRVDKPHLRREVVVREHYTLRLRGGTRSVDDCSQILRLRNGNLTLLLHFLRENGEILGTNNDVQLRGYILRDLSKEFIRHTHRLGLRVLDNTLDVGRSEIRQDRNYGVATRSNSEVANAPIRHIAAQQNDFVALLQASRTEQLLHLGNLLTHLLVGVIIASPQRKGYTLRKFLYTIVKNFVKSIQLHKVVKFLSLYWIGGTLFDFAPPIFSAKIQFFLK